MSIDCSVLSQIRLIDLEAMIVVAETGSFRKASALLSVGQSAITRRIQKLEDALGVSLFERRPTGARSRCGLEQDSPLTFGAEMVAGVAQWALLY